MNNDTCEKISLALGLSIVEVGLAAMEERQKNPTIKDIWRQVRQSKPPEHIGPIETITLRRVGALITFTLFLSLGYVDEVQAEPKHSTEQALYIM